MCAQFLVQIGAEHDVAVLAAFALVDMHHHASRVDIGEFEGCALGAPHASAIEGHEDGDLFRTPDDREMNLFLWVGDFVAGPGALQHLAKEKTQRTDDLIDRVVGEFPVTEKMGRIFTEMLWAELVRGTVEIARQVLDNAQVGARGTFSVIATRDFIERQFSYMGHRDLLVTRTYLRQTPNARVCPREASAGRLSSSGHLGKWHICQMSAQIGR